MPASKQTAKKKAAAGSQAYSQTVLLLTGAFVALAIVFCALIVINR